MEIFYSEELQAMANAGMQASKGSESHLDEDESAHCIKVLRHRTGDKINVIDGNGCMYECMITEACARHCAIRVENANPGWGGHGYSLHVACCPTKNMDRFEWFMEKATEIGIDDITPIIGEHSERRTIKPERAVRLLLAAAKQSLKGKIPSLHGCVETDRFIESSANAPQCLKMIAYCPHDGTEDKRKDMFSEIMRHFKDCKGRFDGSKPEILVMIGPEGDFSEEEAALALSHGFIPVSMGDSRLRTETAALMAVAAAYNAFQTVRDE